MTKIKSYEELKLAKKRSRERIKMLEEEIKSGAEEIKNDLKPINLAGKTLRSMFSSEKHGLVTESVNLSVNALVKGLLFRRTGFITKAILAFAARNLANNAVMKNSENILDWMQVHVRKLKSKHHHNGHYFDESTANADM